MEDLEFGENQLFQGRYGPLTWGIGFVKMPYQETVDAFWRWLEDIGHVKRYQLHQREIKGGFEETLQNLAPLHRTFISKRLFVPTISQWTAYFANGLMGGEPGQVGVISERERCEAVAVRYIPPLAYQQHSRESYRSGGAVDFTLFGRKLECLDEDYGELRGVGVGFDDTRWHFHDYGAYLPFEDVRRFERRQKKDRFTYGMLVEYAHHFGIDPFEETFYMVGPDSPAVIIEAKTDSLKGPSVESMTLEEVQKWLGMG